MKQFLPFCLSLKQEHRHCITNLEQMYFVALEFLHIYLYDFKLLNGTLLKKLKKLV